MIIGRVTKRPRAFDVAIEAEFQSPHSILGPYLWDVGLGSSIEEFTELACMHQRNASVGTLSGDSYLTAFALDAVGIVNLYDPMQRLILSSLSYVHLLKAWRQATDRFLGDPHPGQPIEIRFEEISPNAESEHIASTQLQISVSELM
jgi:hypothetical protein